MPVHQMADSDGEEDYRVARAAGEATTIEDDAIVGGGVGDLESRAGGGRGRGRGRELLGAVAQPQPDDAADRGEAALNLGDHMWHVAGLLSARELGLLGGVSRRMREVSRHEDIWMGLCSRDFGVVYPSDSCTFRETYEKACNEWVLWKDGKV